MNRRVFAAVVLAASAVSLPFAQESSPQAPPLAIPRDIVPARAAIAPAPIAPTRNLVVTGLYRYVRNPIYVAVVAIILGQAVLMGDWRLIVYGALLWLFFHVFVVAYEEPTLERTFGREYEAFRAAVPRWIPRMIPKRV